MYATRNLVLDIDGSFDSSARAFMNMSSSLSIAAAVQAYNFAELRGKSASWRSSTHRVASVETGERGIGRLNQKNAPALGRIHTHNAVSSDL